ncbi:hypothetical protein H8E88_13050 [candidate division KSB1 bacterium]|nr:hypothetical protein [candidate division KSB1 bacterium]MBL7093651.1 hypothetical protein [candidate division KSB1 bacterium]
MNIIEYFQDQKFAISSSAIVDSWEFQEDIRTSTEGFFKTRIHFIDDSKLDVREYVNIDLEKILRYTYSFHYFKNDKLIFRYDNTPHHPQVSSFPHHKHLPSGKVVECDEPNLADVLKEIESILIS